VAFGEDAFGGRQPPERLRIVGIIGGLFLVIAILRFRSTSAQAT